MMSGTPLVPDALLSDQSPFPALGAMSSDTPSVPIFDRLHLMQFLQQYAARGFVLWASDHVRIDRLKEGWTLPSKYDANAGHAVQQRRRRNGLPRVRLVVLDAGDRTRETKDPDHVQWWLISTGQIEGEELLDARRHDERIVLGKFFELVRLPSRGNGPSWTWRVQEEEWQRRCREAVQAADLPDLRKANRLMEDLARWPGAAGLNEQRRELFRKMAWVSHGRLRVPIVAYPRFLHRQQRQASNL